MTLRTTYTYAVLEVSDSAFAEIHAKLRDAGYAHAFHPDPEHGLVIDMHGIGLTNGAPPRPCSACGATVAHPVDERGRCLNEDGTVRERVR